MRRRARRTPCAARADVDLHPALERHDRADVFLPWPHRILGQGADLGDVIE